MINELVKLFDYLLKIQKSELKKRVEKFNCELGMNHCVSGTGNCEYQSVVNGCCKYYKSTLELALPGYEKLYKDKTPRLAIEATKKVLFNDTAKNRSVARSAVIKKIQKYFRKIVKEKQNGL